MWLTGVRLTNWCRFRGTHELELVPGVHAIVARDSEDPRRSNWRGKTSFLAAIRWALFGSRVLDVQQLDDLVSRGEDEASVELEFSNGAFVSRARKRGSSKRDLRFERGELRADGDGAQVLVAELVGMRESDLLTTAWSEQSRLSVLVDASSTESTEAFGGWLGLERLDRAIVAIVERELDEADAEVETLARRIEGLRELADSEAIVELKREVRELELEDARVVRVRAEWADAVQKIVERRLLSSLLAKRDEILEGIERLERASKEQTPELAGLKAAERSADEELSKARHARDGLEAAAGGTFDGACPVSVGFRCPAVVEINSRRRENERALNLATRDVEFSNERLRQARKNLEIPLAAERERERAEWLAASRRKELAKIEHEIANLEMTGVLPWRADEKAPEDPPERPERLAGARSDLNFRKSARAAFEEHESSLATAKRNLKVAAAAASVLEATRRRSLERVVAVARDRANEILRSAGVELAVRDRWTRETGSLAIRCRVCGKAFAKSAREKTCLGCGAERGLKQRQEFCWELSDRSGAARDLVGLALRCGAFRFLREARGSDFSIGAFDEPMSQLDEANREAIGRHLQRMFGATFEQVFVADHHVGFTDAISRKIVITGSGKWSSVGVER